MTNIQIILFCALISIFTMVGCATLCKPPKVVTDTIEQEGAVLSEINSNLDSLSKEELRVAILILIDSNKALKKYFGTQVSKIQVSREPVPIKKEKLNESR